MAAYLIGNAAYPDGNELQNPMHDAADLGAKLKGYGFRTIVATNCTVREMEKKLKEYRKLLDTHDVGLFFFAGHGMQIEGSNYLLALDTDMDSEDDAKHSSLSLDRVIDTMSKSKATTKIIILDACRNNPWQRAWQRSLAKRGLASVYAPKGTIIGFATSPGESASDGDRRNGTYTEALLQHIDSPDCSIETMFKRVRNTVAAATAGKQTSWEHTSLAGEFYFNLSLGKLIDEYDGTALADSLFVLDEAKKSHKMIADLKSHNWYVQNPALDLLDATSAGKMRNDTLFVIGRNIYQAACGSSRGALAFIDEFLTKTRKFDKKRKALLDGILFEIFFDSNGKLRQSIKADCFDEVFDLQRHAELSDSFEFIAESLVAAGGSFYAVPGKSHTLAVGVKAKLKKKEFHVEAVYIGGENVLRGEEESWDKISEVEIFINSTPELFNKRLSEELVAPTRLLNITYSPAAAGQTSRLRLPAGWTVRKK